MTLITLDGRTYSISPTGLVQSAYQHPHQPGRTLWRRMERNSPLSRRVRLAAGIEMAEPASAPRPRDRHYADRHCI